MPLKLTVLYFQKNDIGKGHEPVEVFLWLDPLVGLTTTIASRHWNFALPGMGAAMGMRVGLGDASAAKTRLLRPPGSVAESEFLDRCIRCGECFKVCPGPVLSPAGLEFGLEALWTPVVVPSHAGCHQDCNFCTQVCPTQAIRPLSLSEKRKTSIGLAVINPKTCLSRSGQHDCQLCFNECKAAGYNAIQMRRIELELGDIPEGVFSDAELEAMSSIEAPFVACAHIAVTPAIPNRSRFSRRARLKLPASLTKLLPFSNNTRYTALQYNS
ncbi:MAG: 4Fe-4S dicluster domain-containing protein [Sedimentisphaerales bacterium]|nr:4Fe-4S dicluster domain-containing protein [Sedimentisphaerales bacterium]